MNRLTRLSIQIDKIKNKIKYLEQENDELRIKLEKLSSSSTFIDEKSEYMINKISNIMQEEDDDENKCDDFDINSTIVSEHERN
jgi:regulator of replication initiation timing